MPHPVFNKLVIRTLTIVVLLFSAFVVYSPTTHAVEMEGCTGTAQCEDNDSCTEDQCLNGTCRYIRIANCYSSEGGGYQRFCSGDWYADDPHPLAILCPIVRLFNVLVLSVGAVFVIFVFLSALKYAMAQGDPKAVQGAKQSLTVSIIGILIVVGVFAILTILGNVLGIKQEFLANPFAKLGEGLFELFNKLNIYYTPS